MVHGEVRMLCLQGWPQRLRQALGFAWIVPSTRVMTVCVEIGWF